MHWEAMSGSYETVMKVSEQGPIKLHRGLNSPEVLVLLPKGTELRLLGRASGWSKVRVGDPQVGYLMGFVPDESLERAA